jgi:hypothetical protein
MNAARLIRINELAKGDPLIIGQELVKVIEEQEVELARLRAEAEQADAPEESEPITDIVQLIVPVGPLWDRIKGYLRRDGWAAAGPIPLAEDPVPTYVLQPVEAAPAADERRTVAS